jgi:hypothetical protein
MALVDIVSILTRPNRNGSTPVLKPYTKANRKLVSLRGLALLIAVVGFCFLYGFGFALTAPYLIVPFTVPLLILAILTIWALPDTDRAPVGLMTSLFFLFFLALVLWPNYLAISLPALPWITMLRLVGFPMVLALLIAVSTSPRFRSQMAEALSSVPLIWKLLVGFVVIQTVTLPLSSNVPASFQKYIVAQVYWTAIFFISVYVFSRPGRPMLWVLLLWISALVLCVIGLWEQRLGRVPWAGHIPPFLKVDDEVVQRILSGASRAASGKYRVQATSSTSLGFAEYLALCMPFFMYFLWAGRNVLIRVAAAATIVIAFNAIISTDSRLGVVGTLLSLALSLLFWGIMRWKRAKGSLFGPAVVVGFPILFAGLFASTLFVGRLRRMTWGGGEHQFSNQGRMDQVEAGIPIIARNPVGHGVGQGAEVLGFTNGAGVLTIDTYYLAIALEYGVLGFLVYYAMFLIGTWKAAREAVRAPETDREFGLLLPLSISLAVFLVIKSIFSVEHNHPIAFLMLGMVVALIGRIRREQAGQADLLPAKRLNWSLFRMTSRPSQVR